MRVTVHRLVGGEAMRTDLVTGELKSLLHVGNRISVVADPIDQRADARLFSTSPIIKADRPHYTTKSGSIYLVVEEK